MLVIGLAFLNTLVPSLLNIFDDISDVAPHGALAAANSSDVYMISIADGSFRRRYGPLFDAMSAYATSHGYEWRVLGENETHSECGEERYPTFFFRKHCIVSKWMEGETRPGDRVMVFDADVVPYRARHSLDYWLKWTLDDDLVFYDRTWNSEVMAGNYLVKNTEAGRNFLLGWAEFEHESPPGFSSADNGAIHLHLLRALGRPTAEKCGRMYSNLTALVTNMKPYESFVECTRETLPAGVYKSGDTTIRIMPKDTAWVMDGAYDGYKRDGPGVNGDPAPVFHHGVKLRGDQDKDVDVFYKYNLEQFGIEVDDLQTKIKETCEPFQKPARCSETEGNRHLGNFPTAGECAREAKRHPKCGDTFQFSEEYPDWGCTCCSEDSEPIVREDDLWGLYSSAACLVDTTSET